MNESKEIRVLRYQAWQRAKGELYAASCTYWDDRGSKYELFTGIVKDFIEEVEDSGLVD